MASGSLAQPDTAQRISPCQCLLLPRHPYQCHALPCTRLLAEAYEGDELQQLVSALCHRPVQNVPAYACCSPCILTILALHCSLPTEAYEGDQLRQLVSALCPTIYGHELVKAGLLLSLFGGVRKHGASNNRVRGAAVWHHK